MPQPLVRLATLLTVSFLAVPSISLAQRPIAIAVAPLPSQDTKPAAPKPEPPKPSDVGVTAPPSHLQIPAALAPYLDPGFHPDLQFDPKVPADVDTQALRLEIRLSRRQVTLYRGDMPVKSYAIAVGRPGWETPMGTYEVKQMIKNPTWEHPLEKGVVIPGGDPENPLGRYWIGFWTNGKNWIGFHGTPTPRSVGRAASHGCVRMYNKDVEELFKQVTLGTVVTVVK
ncbi:MAG: L,D-transpeptidase [Verrucomicrobia bacterium]|nr:L,D-transpeptidase [Leptolyngbya sp. ES-bin-22]